jgi:hypothetical protein
MERFKDTKSQVRQWIQDEGYLHPQRAAGASEGAMHRPASAGGYIRKGEGQRRGPSCRDSVLEVRGIAEVDRREKVPAACSADAWCWCAPLMPVSILRLCIVRALVSVGRPLSEAGHSKDEGETRRSHALRVSRRHPRSPPRTARLCHQECPCCDPAVHWSTPHTSTSISPHTTGSMHTFGWHARLCVMLFCVHARNDA